MFGINHYGEPAFDDTWCKRLNLVNVVISRFVTCDRKEFLEKLIDNKQFIILHVTCSGWGGSAFEPNVPTAESIVEGVLYLIDSGFPRNQIVLRIDPLFVNTTGLRKVVKVLDLFKQTEISRVRYSTFVPTACTRNLFMEKFHKIPKNDAFDVASFFHSYGFYSFEQCHGDGIGCISKKDLISLGITDNYNEKCLTCNCLAPAIELLPEKGKKCIGGCIYCNRNQLGGI